MRRLPLALLALLVLAAGAGAWLAYRLEDRPSLEPYAAHALVPPAPAPGPVVRVTFLGVSTLLISDGQTSLMTDGFFSRPSKLASFFGRVAPDPPFIASMLQRAGVLELAAVAVVHSHYDHAMDAPEVARQTRAVLLGSESTANVARGWGLREEKIRVVRPGEPQRFGDFEVTLIPSRHLPHGMAMGEITQPLRPPAHVSSYLEGGSYSVLVAHPLGRLLVQGSAGWLEGALDGQHADVVFLGVGGLGSMDAAYRDGYWRGVVDAVGARCVVPVHWDDFTLPLDEPLRPMPRLLDDFDLSMRFLLERAQADPGVAVGMIPPWTPVTFFGAGAVDCGGRGDVTAP